MLQRCLLAVLCLCLAGLASLSSQAAAEELPPPSSSVSSSQSGIFLSGRWRLPP